MRLLKAIDSVHMTPLMLSKVYADSNVVGDINESNGKCQCNLENGEFFFKTDFPIWVSVAYICSVTLS